jgi:hypothetical protein
MPRVGKKCGGISRATIWKVARIFKNSIGKKSSSSYRIVVSFHTRAVGGCTYSLSTVHYLPSRM